MGEPNVARVDGAALFRIGMQYDAVAGVVDDAVRNHVTALAFGGACAGRTHVASGEALRRALDDAVGQLRGWSRAAAEIASVLRDSAHRYAEADSRAAGRVG